MRLTIVFLLFFQGWIAGAQSQSYSQPLFKYYDCSPHQTPNLPLFMAAGDGATRVYANDFFEGVQVNAIGRGDGSIAAVQIGPNIVISLSQLRNGVRFGFPHFPVHGKTLHTVEVSSDFDPMRGGRIRFGFLRKLTVGMIAEALAFGDPAVKHVLTTRELAKRLQVRGHLSQHFLMRDYHKSNWGEFTVLVYSEGGRWVVRDESGMHLAEIFALLDVDRAGQVKGVRGMLGISPGARPPACYKPASGK